MAVQNNKAEGTVLLEMKHVKKSFDKSGVLKDISLKVREGQVVSIIGPSGSGKSTLVDYGFRLPSAKDNRPLNFEEFESMIDQMMFVSATPNVYEQEHVQRFLKRWMQES